MKFHWFSTHLVVLAALLGLLNAPLYGATRHPQRCEICCPPTGCINGQYFQHAVSYHSQLNTQQIVHNTNITDAQAALAAGDLRLAKQELDQDGGMAQFTAVILDYASVFEAANPNFNYYYPEMVKLGYVGTEADLLLFAKTTTQQQRIDFVNQVRSGGMDSIFETLIGFEEAIAEGQDGGPQCATASQTAAWFGVAAAGAALLAAGGVAPAVGVAAVFGFVSAVFTLDYVMMGC
jgi:hypothetical protein